MRSLTWSQAKSKIARVLDYCVTDSRVLEFANEAQERLLNRPNDPVGSWLRYQVCVGTTAELVWPRQIRTIRAYAICKEPGILHSEWFNFIGYGSGGLGLLDSEDMPGNMLIDRGTTCCFKNIVATTAAPRKIQAVAANAADNGKKITLRYIDSSGNRKYTSIDGSIQEGEELTLSTTGVLTSSNVLNNGLYHVVKATTDYPVRLYAYDPDGATQTSLLAVYEPSETNPIYRRTFVPGLTEMAACEGASDGCSADKSITILAKLQHVPVVVDNDPFVIGNLPALADMAKSIQMREMRMYDDADRLEATAQRELDGEIASYMGDGMQLTVKMPDSGVWGPGGILNCV